MCKQLAQSTKPTGKSTLPEHITCAKDIECEINREVNLRLLDDDACPAVEPAGESDSDVEMLDGPPGACSSKHGAMAKATRTFREPAPPSTRPSTTRRSQADRLVETISARFDPKARESRDKLCFIRSDLHDLRTRNEVL